MKIELEHISFVTQGVGSVSIDLPCMIIVTGKEVGKLLKNIRKSGSKN